MTYILILWCAIDTSRAVITSAQFTTRAACEAAGATVIERMHVSELTKYVCVKGE